MRKLLKELPLFVEVARLNSFSQAADALDMPVSSLSRRISALEKTLGVTLLNRSTRTVELTEGGKDFFFHCERVLAEAQEACDALLGDTKRAAGKVRVCVRGDIFHAYFAEAFVEFARAWPDIELQIKFIGRWVDLVSEPYDLGLYAGGLKDSSVIVRKIGDIIPAPYAAPQFLATHPAPATPQALSQMPCIRLEQFGDNWTFQQGNDTRIIPVKGAHSFNCTRACLLFTLAGLGVGVLESFRAEPHVHKEELVRLLPDWNCPPAPVSVVLAGRRVPRRVRLMIDHLAAHFGALTKR